MEFLTLLCYFDSNIFTVNFEQLWNVQIKDYAVKLYSVTVLYIIVHPVHLVVTILARRRKYLSILNEKVECDKKNRTIRHKREVYRRRWQHCSKYAYSIEIRSNLLFSRTVLHNTRTYGKGLWRLTQTESNRLFFS